MAIKQPQQFARWITGLAAGATVAIEGDDPDLRTALHAEGARLGNGPCEFLVLTGPSSMNFTPATKVVLAPAGERLMELLRHAGSNGFLPDLEVTPPEYSSDWVLLRRSDAASPGRIDALASAAADLASDRDRLRELLNSTTRELRSWKNSPAGRMIGAYRKWLARQRKRNLPPFEIFDKVTGTIVTKGTASLDLDDGTSDQQVGPGIAPAARFSDVSEGPEDWRRIFGRLAAHSGVNAANAPPKISIVTPLWNTKAQWLAEAAVSVFDQTSAAWEWCIVDDCSTDTSFTPVLEAVLEASPRVRFERLERNQGISQASNAGLELARGEYVCFLDHDDLLHPEAFELCLENLEDGCDAVYSDSNKVSEEGVFGEPFYKPDWSPEYFRGVMYVGHLLCVKREGALALGGFDSRFDGVQDFEFFLRYSERHKQIGHISRILYHWRTVEGSTATSTSAKKNISQLQQLAVAGQLERLGLAARAVRGPRPHRVTVEPGPKRDSPRVSIVIPTKDAPAVLSKCLESIFTLSTYENLQVICADNETADPKALALMKRPGVDRVLCPGKFNFSRVNNQSVKLAEGEFLIFLNNDIEVLTKDWIEQMLYHAEQEDVGAVGSLLLYPNRKVQHCGIALGFRGTADHILRGADPGADGYAGSLAHARECSALTAACLMVRKKLFEDAGGFDEHFHTAYQDVDLCLRLHALGKRNIYTPKAVLIHHESYTRKSYYDMVDRTLLLDRWEQMMEAGDPFYNINFDRSKVDYRVSPEADAGEVPPRVSLWSPGQRTRAGLAAATSRS